MTARLTDAELDELGRLERAATPREWFVDDDGRIACYGNDLHVYDLVDTDDMLLAVAARSALPSLLAEVRETRTKLARVEGYRERLASEMRASAHRLAFFRYDAHAHIATELAALAAQGEYDAAIFGEPAEGGAT